MIKIGDYVKVWTDLGQHMVEVSRGFVHVMGQGMVEIRDNNQKKRYSLSVVFLERYSPDANEMKPANLPYIPHIKNKATGSGFTKKGGKVKFNDLNVWESRPGRF